MWVFIGVICLLISGCSVVALPFVRGKRKKVGALAATSFVVMIVALVMYGIVIDDEARRLGFVDAADQRAATDAGVRDPVAWHASRDAVAAKAAAAVAKAKQEERENVARPALTSVAPALPVKDEPLPSATVGSPGVAKICLTDGDIHLRPKDEIVIPATTVFEDDGPNVGKPEDPSTWRYEVKEGFIFPAEFVTLAAVSLRKSKPCAETKVQMRTGAVGTETMKRASDNHIFVIDDVLDYPIPTERPPIEIGKLIDDISVEAMLITDVTQAVARPDVALDDDATSATCLAGAKKLAAYLGGGTGQQRSMNIEIGHVGADTVQYGCPFGPKQKVDFEVYWDKQARPPSKTMALIAKGGEFVTGATRAELIEETSECVADALKPDAGEIADRQVRGVKIECQAFTRDGGGGSVTIYRRFGPDPVRTEISTKATIAADQASDQIKAEEARQAADALRFAEWYQDPTIPKKVKAFTMMAARVIALQERCPSSKLHDDRIAQWASDAGVKSSDIEPGGRYAYLMTMMLAEMQAGTAKETIAEACEAAKKYD
jgi:hypothetical protein